MDLVVGGNDLEVTSSNIYQYVRKYGQHRLVHSQEKVLEKLQEGLFDMIPVGALKLRVESLNTFTTEDFRWFSVSTILRSALFK